MRLKPKIAITVGVLLFACALVLWRYGIQHRARNINPASGPVARLAQHPPLIKTAATNAIPAHKSYRITNTHQSFAKLLHNPHAIILRNALIDTEVPVALKIPDHLRAKGAPGSYLVQSDRPLDNGFYAELRKEGASYVSYIPNNAALVKATPEAATNLAALPDIVAVLPYEPYYKLDSTLLPNAVEQQPETNQLSITTFPGQRDAALAELTQLGASLIGEDRSPFGPTFIVNIPSNSLVAVAQMPLAQEIEAYTPRHKANDLTRVIMNVAVNTSSNTPNYLNLTGSNVTVNLNDTGVDATHPDFTPTNRLIGDFPASLFDPDGHGTHVAGIIAGNGRESYTVTNLPPGTVLGASYRGKATNATLFVQSLDLVTGPYISDSFLQENASTNLGPTNLISNNSWDYDSEVYDMHAASYDAATRDAQPNVDGEQPLLFVFAAGNNGNYSGTINSPATAKNVITVGASDSPRFITNLVSEDGVTTNEVFYGDTSSTNTVASFSSCGNVDADVEGFYGRFKPDVVAPGVFTVSCRSSQYTDPSNAVFVTQYPNLGQVVDLKQTNYYALYIPGDTSGAELVISSNLNSPVPFPTNMFIYADTNYPPEIVVSTNNFYALTNFNPGDIWFFGVASPTNSPGPVNYDLNIYLFETNYEGDYFQVLSNLNNPLKPYYMYQSGTSMSAGAVSGYLALMQEFLQQDMGITNPSPALMKAMLINGSRSMGIQYDFNVTPLGPNEQGWGLPNLINTLPGSLTNGKPSMVLIDQSTSNALATGQYQTYSVNCTDTNATNLPVRITLVWTDPPGDPAAGIALVNNLELTVADATGSNIFIGNNFPSGGVFTQATTPTNMPPGQSDNDVNNVFVNQGTASFTTAGDIINNVQNIYINPTNTPVAFPLTVTISATRIDVNAVTTQTNNILQDYALVISSDDVSTSNQLQITTNAAASTNAPLITIASNNAPLLHQRVGANEPNLYNFSTSSTNGNYAQWHFFIFTNSELVVSNTTNVAFATFLPPNLSIPRSSGSADIDMYVYTNPITDFTNFISDPLNLEAFAEGAVKSVGRTGNESVIFTNSTVPVYYIGIKSEDQQASDFGFYGVAQQQPFSTSSADGQSITATGSSLPLFIPNSLSPTPALAFAFMFNPNPVLNMIRRVTVTEGVQFPTPDSLYGTLQHNGANTVLNNFSSTSTDPGFTNTYDDLQENPNSGDVTSDGPGSLTQYINGQPDGLWLFAEANSDQSLTGYLTQYTVSVDLQQPQTTGFFVTIPGNSWFDDYVDVPNDATNMTIYTLYESEGTNNGSTGPIGIYLTNEVGEITFSDYGSNNISPPGGSLSLSTNNPVPGWPGAPPLAGGYWYYGIYNYSSQPVTLYVQIVFQESLTPNLVQTYTNNEFIPLTTDGHTQSQICISNGQQLVDLQVGLRINDTNLDDLVIHLTSPEGTSVLLFEDRGGTNADALGLSLLATNGTTNLATNFVYTVFTEDTNLADTPIKFAPPPYASNEVTAQANLYSTSFEDVTNGTYTNGAILDGWLVTNTIVDVYSNGTVSLQTNDTVGIVTDPAGEIYGATNLGSNYLALTSGRIVQTFGVTNTFAVTNGQPYELVFYAKPMGVTNWWPANGNTDDLISGDTGTIPYNDVTYSQGEYDKAFTFSGIHPHVIISNEVDFGTSAGNFGTNDFTMDFWIKVPAGQTGLYGIAEKRQDCSPYNSYFDIHLGREFGFDPTTNGAFFFDCASQGSPASAVNYCDAVSTNAINDGKYHHAAFVRQSTNLFIYIDGLLSASGSSATGVANITNSQPLRLGQSACSDGSGGPNDPTQAFIGELDEFDTINRALSPAEIYGIYHAGVLGKYNTNSILPNFNLTIDGVETNNIVLSNSAGGWELFTNSFTATNNTITVEFAGNPMGVLLDDIQLIQLPATNYANYYLPEEPITPFIGENPLGCWTLDVWDTRQDSPLPTNGELLSWTLQLTTSSTNAMLYVLTNGQPYNVTNASSNSITYFAIDVPSYATFATNILTANSGNSVTLFFDQNALPTGGLPGDYTLAPNVAIGTSSTNTLSTVGLPPPLIPGRRYFLGVLDNGAGNANFTIEVNFNGSTNEIIPLTNEIPYTNIVSTNIIGTNGPEYYSFVAPTNAIMVTFQILNPSNGEVDLYAREGLPVPGPSLFDYASANSGTNDQFIVVTTNSLPVALPVWTNILPVPKPTTWYLAAYNPAGVSNITYSIVASFVTNTASATNVTGNSEMTIIALSNAVPYTNTALPGYPTNLLYSFTVTNNPSGVEFTVTNLTNVGNVQLLADINGFPTPQDPYAGSFNVGVTNQIIQIVPSANLPSLNGTWYLAVPNTSKTNVLYSIEALTNFIVAPPLTALTWSGAVDDVWDILATSNWVATSNTSLPYPYQNASALTFDDSAVGPTTINIEEAVTPGSVTFNNNILAYTFNGAGGISGAPLTMNGTEPVMLDNSGANVFSSVSIGGGILQIGNNDTNGSLGPTAVVDTGTGSLIFDRTDNLTVSNVISDNGSLSQLGSGVLTLAGVNSYTGGTTISNGTIIVDNTNALGSGTGDFAPVIIENGGTLDLGGIPTSYGPTSPLFDGMFFKISGAGANGAGAIVNNGTNAQLGGLEVIELTTGNASIGGSARWDIRNNAATVKLGGFSLTKTGTNQINMASTSVNLGNIIVAEGILSFEGTPNFRFDPSGTYAITVEPGGLLGGNLDALGSFTRAIVLAGGGFTNLSGSNTSYLDASITLTNNSWLGNGAGYEIFDGIISGSAALTNLGIGTNVFAATNTYTGATYIAQGTLELTNNGSISNSATILVSSGALLDASERVDQTLTLGTNQTLINNGLVAGNTVAGAGSTVLGTGNFTGNLTTGAGSILSPGPSLTTIGSLTGNTTITLGAGSTTVMKLNKALAPGQTNDILVASNLFLGGTLVVTNYDNVDPFVAGDSFRIFSAANTAGTFGANLILPPLPPGLAWTNNFAGQGGTITVVNQSAASGPGVRMSITLSGSNIIFTGTNGTPFGQYVILTSTDMTAPLSTWTPVATNFFDSNGDFSMTIAVSNVAAQFYILQSQ